MEKLNIIFGIVGVVGTGFSIYGAIKSTKESKKAGQYLKEINEKKSAFDLGILINRVDNLHKDIYGVMIARKTTRGSGKELDTYRKWCEELTIILSEIPVEMNEIIESLEVIKDIISSCIIDEMSLHNYQYDDDSGFRKVELSIYNISKELKNRSFIISTIK